MIDKFEKRDKCEYCEKPLEAKYRNKRFCSTKCRVYFGRENKKPPTTSVGVIREVAELMGKEAVAVTSNVVLPKKALIENSAEPKEGTLSFFRKYDCMTYEELKNKQK